MQTRIGRARAALFTAVLVAVVSFLSFSGIQTLRNGWESAFGIPTGGARLVSIEEAPEIGEMCQWVPATPEQLAQLEENNLFSVFDDQPTHAATLQDAGTTVDVSRPPVRRILDTDPIYSSISVDTRLNEVFMQDTNTWSIKVFNRLDNTAPDAARTEPKRVIGGPKTDVQFNSCIYIDPLNGDIYSAENDIGDSIVVFSHDAEGDVVPIRKLKVTHRAHSLAVDEDKQELYVSVQYPPQIAVYRKLADGDEKPRRLLKGESTRLSDVHGIAVDTKRKLLYASNWGNISEYTTPGTGRFESPSISVYPLDSDGDAPPIRVIQGPKTQLNWPGGMSLDPDTGDLYVANDMGHSVIVFRGPTDKGDTQPYRVIKGRRTGLSYPTGVFVDTKNRELWVSNLGNSSATVFPLAANGDVAPIRTVRSAPAGKVSLRFGKTQAVAYDSKRDQILVPN